ncbi:MAG: hypothetical protein J1E65_07725 [Lachnospiraceae bacterium]|nr:hypothetical protein [Lachnospiraceae bacterium]
MKERKNFFRSFIPKHIDNSFLLGIYQMLTWIPVSKKIRENHYKSNVEQLHNTDWDFWTVPSAYIENQNDWGKIMYGTGAHHNMRYSGCEIIATFNALKAFTGAGSPESMAKLISEYEARGSALKGEFGVSPRAIEAYFKRNHYQVITTDNDDEKSLYMVDRQSHVLIATVYNDANDITEQIHTVCITKEPGKGYVLHNAYRRDQAGKYVASAPYGTLLDAIKHISRRDAQLIYLIGIARE